MDRRLSTNRCPEVAGQCIYPMIYPTEIVRYAEIACYFMTPDAHANQLIFKEFSGGMYRPETSLYVLHLKREKRSKSLIFMAYWGCRPAFPPRFTPQDAWAAVRQHATAADL